MFLALIPFKNADKMEWRITEGRMTGILLYTHNIISKLFSLKINWIIRMVKEIQFSFKLDILRQVNFSIDNVKKNLARVHVRESVGVMVCVSVCV